MYLQVLLCARSIKQQEESSEMKYLKRFFWDVAVFSLSERFPVEQYQAFNSFVLINLIAFCKDQ